MENAGKETWTYMFVGIIVIVITQLYFYLKRNNNNNNNGKKNTATKNEASIEKVKDKHSTSSQSSISVTSKHPKHPKKQSSNNWKTKSTFAHPLLRRNLLGHTNQIMDIDCTSDGKFLISCADDELLHDPGESSSSRSSSEGSRTPPGGSPKGERCMTRQSRRRKKTRSSRDISTTHQEISTSHLFVNNDGPEQFIRFKQMKMKECELVKHFSHFLLNDQQLVTLGYPVESPNDSSKALIFTQDFKKLRGFDVNAKEFVPGVKVTPDSNRDDDSGRGSGSSSPRSADSDPDTEDDSRKACTQHSCIRCHKKFFISHDGQYIERERCKYHWGRLYDSWTCCGGFSAAAGCAKGPCHVWSGKVPGINGPLNGFVRTARKAGKPRYGILALDCEMSYTANGFEAVKLEVIKCDGKRIYGTYIRPAMPILDYNTKYSGISENDLKKNCKTLEEVQDELLQLIDSQTILVGHGLENDLRVLKILHKNIVDTAICFPHAKGLPFRQSLKSLAAQHLEQTIQEGKHCPLEDARVSLELMLWKIQHDPFSFSFCESTINNKISYSYVKFLMNFQKSIALSD